MTQKIEKSPDVLNKLLRINNNHAAYYRWASKKTQELNLKAIFNQMSSENERNALELEREIGRASEIPLEDNRVTGNTISNILVRIKEMLTWSDRKSILDSCADGEDTLQAAYQQAISSIGLSMQTRQVIRNQLSTSKALYETMMSFRNGDPIGVFS